MKCDQCEMLMIQGIACHERGCPNMGARWDKSLRVWVPQRTCFNCGYTCDADLPCCDDEEYPIDADGVA
jgi:hypothetical protein